MTSPHAESPALSPDLARELANHAGRWVAVDLQRVVATGDTAADVVRKALANGSTDPLIFHVALHPDRAAVL